MSTKMILRLLLLLATVCCGTCAITASPLPVGDNAEKINEYIFEVGEFNKIRVLDNVNVIYRCVPDSTGLAAYHGVEDFRDAFIFTNNNGTLKIQVTTDDVNKPGLPTIRVYSDYLTEAENSSVFTLKVENPAPCAEFKARQEGNGAVHVEGIRSTKATGILATGMGTIVLAGQCNSASLKMIGTGIIQADRLKAASVDCRIMGSGTIGCWPTENLKVKGIGSTKIFYKGNPEIKKTGGGKILPLSDQDSEEKDDTDKERATRSAPATYISGGSVSEEDSADSSISN